MNKIYYSQVDNRWKNHPYPSTTLPRATIGSGGCGVCTCAMIISMLKEIVLPPVIADMFVKDEIRVVGGTSVKAYSYIAEKYGLQTRRTTDYNDVISSLQRGCIIAVGCGKGLFTTGDGHIICIAGIEENNFIIHDSYLYTNKFKNYGRNNGAIIRGTEVVCPIDSFKKYANAGGFWIYEPTVIDTNKDESIVEPIKNNRNTVGTKKKFARNVTLYSSSDKTGTYYSYLKNTTVEVLENTTDTMDKIYVPATKRTAYVEIIAYTDFTPTTPEFNVMTVTAKSGLRIRNEANTTSKINGVKPLGYKVKVYGISNGWARVDDGYMYAEYLK